jgi:DNA-binding XRE family transcriptional regulator
MAQPVQQYLIGWGRRATRQSRVRSVQCRIIEDACAYKRASVWTAGDGWHMCRGNVPEELDPDVWADIHGTVRAVRAGVGWSLSQLGRAVGRTKQAIWASERGITSPLSGHIESLARTTVTLIGCQQGAWFWAINEAENDKP